MGYYVNLIDSDWFIPKEREAAALQALRDLNFRHELKSGGRSPESGDPFDDKWFAWMPPRYHEEQDLTVAKVLQYLGFESADSNEFGTSCGGYYDSKTGSEEIFMMTLAPFVQDGSYMEWQGEDAERWRWVFRDGTMVIQEAIVTWRDL